MVSDLIVGVHYRTQQTPHTRCSGSVQGCRSDSVSTLGGNIRTVGGKSMKIKRSVGQAKSMPTSNSCRMENERLCKVLHHL